MAGLTKVAVYGSLRKNLYNHYLIADQEFIKKIAVEVPYKMISMNGAYPALLPSKDKHEITFELYEVDANTSRNLDILEGYPDFYSKATINIDGEEYLIYWLNEVKLNGAKMPDVESGDWYDYKTKQILRK